MNVDRLSMNHAGLCRRLLGLALVLVLAGQAMASSEPRLPLERAAHEGNTELVESLLEEGQSQYARDSALECAIQAGHRKITELLISHGAKYALVKAAEQGDLELVKDLLAREREAKDLDSAFHAAVRMQQKPIAEFLIAQGADVDVRRFSNLTPLFVAVTGERDTNFARWIHSPTDRYARPARDLPKAQEMVDFLIKHGADVNAVGGSPKLVPLYYAIHGGSTRIVETLLAHGAEANFRVQTQWLESRFTTPLHLTADYGDLAMCELLIQHGAEVNVRTSTDKDSPGRYIHKTPLHHAVRSGNVKLVELLLDRGADVNGVDSRGETALHYGVWSRKRPSFEHLLARVTDADGIDGRGETATDGATYERHSIVELLLSRGADVNVSSERGHTPLHYAAEKKDRAVVEMLLERGADADAKNNKGQTPTSTAVQNGSEEIVQLLTAQLGQTTLHSAASMGDIEAMARLVDSGVSVDRIDIQDRTALHAAVQAGQIRAVEWLLAHGADPNYPDDNAIAPLSVAFRISQGHSFSRDPNEVARFNALQKKQKEILVLLIRHGAAPSFRYGIPLKTVLAHPAKIAELLVEAGTNFEPGTDEQATLLHRAAWWGEKDIVAQLLDLGADVHATDRFGGTPLHAAMQTGSTRYWDVIGGPHIDVVELLLDHGANVNAINSARATPLHGAASYGDANTVDLLIQHGANVNAIDKANRTPLHEAGERGSIEAMDLLITSGADPNIVDNEGNTPLLRLLCSFMLRREEAKTRAEAYALQLIQQGVRVDVQNHRGVTPLQRAAAMGSQELMEKLLSRDADPNATSPEGWTALHSAVSSEKAECVKILIRHGADVNGSGRQTSTVSRPEYAQPPRTPLHIALRKKNGEIVRMLIAAGANVNARDSRGGTPLHLAFGQNHLTGLKLLLDHGADANAQSSNGIPLVYLGASQGRRDVVDLLLQHGANADKELVQALLDTGTTALHEAAKAGDVAKVRALLATDMEVNIPDRRGKHPIHHAHAEGHQEVVGLLLPKTPGATVTHLLFQDTKGNANEMIALLIANGADVNAKDLQRGESLLHRSAWRPDPNMIEFLLAHGADINLPDRGGQAPLVRAVMTKQRDIVALLLTHGADANAVFNTHNAMRGRPLLDVALGQDSIEIAAMLVRAGADVTTGGRWAEWTPLHMALDHRDLFELMLAHGGQIDLRSRDDKTPLHMAGQYGMTDSVEYLIEKGASINTQDEDGNTPLHLAAKKGHGATCKALIRCGADITLRNKKGRPALDYALASDLEDVVELLKPALGREPKEVEDPK